MKKARKSEITKQAVEQIRLDEDEITRADMPNMSRGKSNEDNYN